MKKKTSKMSKAVEKLEAAAGRKENRSKKHKMAEARGMKKSMRGC